jgi:hypothetical protein
MVNNGVVYEFSATQPQAWIKVTTTSGGSVSLAGGGSLTVFTAEFGTFSAGSFSFAASSAWWYEANGGTPTLNAIYAGRLLGFDTSGTPVWASAVPAGRAPSVGLAELVNSATITSAPQTIVTLNSVAPNSIVLAFLSYSFAASATGPFRIVADIPLAGAFTPSEVGGTVGWVQGGECTNGDTVYGSVSLWGYLGGSTTVNVPLRVVAFAGTGTFTAISQGTTAISGTRIMAVANP